MEWTPPFCILSVVIYTFSYQELDEFNKICMFDTVKQTIKYFSRSTIILCVDIF